MDIVTDAPHSAVHLAHQEAYLKAGFSLFCSTVPGLIFLLTGLLKALAPSSMFSYFQRLGIKDWRRLRVLVWSVAVAECVLGMALMLRAFPPLLFPGTLVLIIAFAAFTARNAKKGDCACYGKLLTLSPAKSIALDIVFAALVVTAWLIPVPAFLPLTAGIAILAGSSVLFAAVATIAHQSFVKPGKDWLDLNPSQVGRKWNAEWLQGFADVANGDQQLVVLMTSTCPHCKVWIKPLNKIARRSDMPQVIAAMAASAGVIRGLVAQHGIVFPVLRVKESIMDRIAAGYPEVVMLEKGVVRAKPGAHIPEDLAERLKSSLNPARRPLD